jgi:uncharacterized membrane protein
VAPWLWIALLWAGFAGAHLYLSGASVRPRLVARLGPDAFRGVYSLVALIWFGCLVWYYAHHKHTGPLLWTTLGPPALARALSHALMFLAFALLVPAVLPAHAAPSSMAAGGSDAGAARGLVRITRHPLLVGLALFGLAHLLVNGRVGDVVFFGGFPLFVWAGARHQDARLSGDRPGYRNLVAQTSVVPFAAVVAGRQRLVAAELPWGAIAAGLVLAAIVRWWHASLFGP